MKNFRFAICNITQELQEVQKFGCAFKFVVKSAVINIVNCQTYKYELKMCFDQLQTVYSYLSLCFNTINNKLHRPERSNKMTTTSYEHYSSCK